MQPRSSLGSTIYLAVTGTILLTVVTTLCSQITWAQGGTRNGLPPTSMDSFVHEAGAQADRIYGDEGGWRLHGEHGEGADLLPPYYGFSTMHRINSGISGQRAAGLTTGHGSMLPDAWGRDEFIGGTEWSESGSAAGSSSSSGAWPFDTQSTFDPQTSQPKPYFGQSSSHSQMIPEQRSN